MNLHQCFYGLLAITLLLVTACTKEQVQPQTKSSQLTYSPESAVAPDFPHVCFVV